MAYEQRFIGGVKSMKGGNASRPLAELLVGEEYVLVQLRFRWMRRLLRGWLRTEIALLGAQAKPVARYWMSRGLIVGGTAEDGSPAGVVFWCSCEQRDRLVTRLRQVGVEILDKPGRQAARLTQSSLGTLDSVDENQETRLAARRSRLMHTLALRWEPDVETWAYDDADIGVHGEPFVLGADAMLTHLRALQVGPGLDPFRVVFSASRFPGALEARRLEEEDGGVWYEAALGDQILRGWLCGHFFDYFATAPPVVYVRAESLG